MRVCLEQVSIWINKNNNHLLHVISQLLQLLLNNILSYSFGLLTSRYIRNSLNQRYTIKHNKNASGLHKTRKPFPIAGQKLLFTSTRVWLKLKTVFLHFSHAYRTEPPPGFYLLSYQSKMPTLHLQSSATRCFFFFCLNKVQFVQDCSLGNQGHECLKCWRTKTPTSGLGCLAPVWAGWSYFKTHVELVNHLELTWPVLFYFRHNVSCQTETFGCC